MTQRITDRFAACAAEGRPALVTFIMSGDPDYETASAILRALPGAGADLIELGMPFSDPMADGPGIQAAGQRALKAGQTLNKTLAMVADFRKADTTTPIVLMGYYNPIYIHGVDKFITDALAAGVDGLIVVDLPPEEDSELCVPALKAGLNFIRLHYPDGTTVVPKNKDLITGVPKGTIYHQVASGGGGYGDPKRRDRKLLAEEIRNGVISEQAAREKYGYVPEQVA